MTHRCSNPKCPYGPEWDQGLEVTYDGPAGTVPPAMRATAYGYANAEGVVSYDGLCLNCLDDDRRDREMADSIYPDGLFV